MAEVKPFRALRYGEQAGRLADLVAPPYDVISPADREEYLARSPYNVVHLTLPDSEEQAGRDFETWQRDGILVPDGEPAVWALSQDYVGPDGVARTRNGIVASLRLEPYDRRVVLPHERTHSGPKEGRLRLLRATRAELEPIFVLHDGPTVELPEREPDLGVDRTRLWRIDDAALEAFAGRQLLIADGHHRYETALAFHDEDRTEPSAYTMAALVSTNEQGLTIFPTHRIARRFDGELDYRGADWRELLRAIGDRRTGQAAVVVVTARGAAVAEGEGLDTELVERLGPEELSYTPSAHEAVAAVERGEAEAAFLLRPPSLDQVWSVAGRGDTMPQKSTYFFPKLLSGLLFYKL